MVFASVCYLYGFYICRTEYIGSYLTSCFFKEKSDKKPAAEKSDEKSEKCEKSKDEESSTSSKDNPSDETQVQKTLQELSLDDQKQQEKSQEK